MESSTITFINGTAHLGCATDIQMYQRHSGIFITNVFVSDIFHVISIVGNPVMIIRLHRRPVFPDSMTVLFWLIMVTAFAHSIIYAIIQNWSFARAFLNWNDPCNIMFNEYECLYWYRANIFSRLQLLSGFIFQTIEIMLIDFAPRFKPSYLRGAVLSVMSLITSEVVCLWMTSDSPTDKLAPNCLQRQGRNLSELKAQLWVYTVLIFLAMLIASLRQIALKRKVKPFIVSEEFLNRTNENATRFLVVQAFFLLLLSLVYSVGVTLLIEFVTSIDPKEIGNLTMWFYTYTYAAAILPISLHRFQVKNTNGRRNAVSVLVTVNSMAKSDVNTQTDKHFEQLRSQWAGPPSLTSVA